MIFFYLIVFDKFARPLLYHNSSSAPTTKSHVEQVREAEQTTKFLVEKVYGAEGMTKSPPRKSARRSRRPRPRRANL